MFQQKLKPAIKRKYSVLLIKINFSQRDNACYHTVQLTRDKLQELSLWGLPHPAFSSDIDLSDFHLLGPFKVAFLQKRCGNHVNIKEAKQKWLREKQNEFFANEIGNMTKRQ